ncbi:nickel pincer cofactor biosynthesis protein LarC [Blautia luti]|uniref:nickel pincer cofactor biosynthesis protein LarC n=1 Tax=Blautia luti TaxID=89014 RepID=UPI001D01F14E|nr:nickel pincer cofactor biosynthesis protein LarC [Blautia luti]MCB5474138.1 nickel pincer cofactor biosynthesis protein LarC [Blautia luti]
MKNKLYLECTSGISGDMAVAALLDLGASREKLKKVLKSLPVKGFDIKISRVVKSGIDACDFDVVLDEEHENHDHDMGYLHGHEHGGYSYNEARHGHEHGEHSHEHGESHSHHGHHHHEHRGLNEIMTIIDHADMADRARSYAKKIFTILAEAEAKAHNVPADQVHFHEVGAVDSIVDILSVAVCMDDLDVEEVIIPRLCEGSGTIRCQHGILPVPVPAVSNIVSAHHLKLHITPVQGELVTPTGAAIAAAFITSEKLPEDFTVEKIGIGAGKRQYECPGILRAMLIREAEKNTEIQKFSDTESDIIIKLESNIDDCSGETLGYVMELLYEAGAREANYMPAFMKKNRPAWLLTVICKEDQVSGMERIIFKETTTIGIRHQKMERTVLKREKRTVVTPLGDVEVKVCIFDGQEYIYPEYESVKKICKKTGVSYREAYHMAVCG